MEELTMRSHAGTAFKESRYNNPYSDPERREVYKRCFTKGFIAGVKMYANHLYNKGSVFDAVDSIRRTAEYEKWAPLASFENVVLIALKRLGLATELEKKVILLEEELKREERKADKQTEEYEGTLKLKDQKIAELESILAGLKKQGYK